MTLIAKPVIPKQFWILQDGNEKVGNIEACAGGYQVKINNQVAQFKTIKMAAQRVNIEFEAINHSMVKKPSELVYGFETGCRTHNPMWDVKMKLPVFTKKTKSKSWFAAGWYKVKKGRNWSTVQNPKIILLQRYMYLGPFHSEQEADHESTHTTIC
jgi:hypothetical protein